MTDIIKFTSIFGGGEGGPVCSLLEIGDIRILLDCGYFVNENDFDGSLLSKIGRLDAVLLSHSDINHIGGLPLLFGENGYKGVPVVCTLPVFKMGQMVLYDWFSNLQMEGIDKKSNLFSLDDVDSCFENVVTAKFHENLKIQCQMKSVSLRAHPAGRTIGGAAWIIRHGAAEVLYMMDFNLRKELVLDGSAVDSLPVSPSLLVVEGGCSGPARTSAKGIKRLKDRDDQLVNMVMETVRSEGHVLLPVESCSRVLEMIQILGKHWQDGKFQGMYHLVFLSPMAKNILEFAKSQLEWMSDSLSKSFYVGKPNPFSLPSVKICTSLKQLEALGSGPKVVMATDASLSFGLSKELLLRWGGDPRCRVIFTDQPEPGTLAFELWSQSTSPPVIATISRPERVPLVGEELVAFLNEQEAVNRKVEEELSRKRREKELMGLMVDGSFEDENEDDVDEDTSDGADIDPQAPAGVWSMKRSLSDMSSGTASGATTRVRKRVVTAITDGGFAYNSMGRLAAYAQPRYPMFETISFDPVSDDYGFASTDIEFHDMVTSSTLIAKHGQQNRYKSNLATQAKDEVVLDAITADGKLELDGLSGSRSHSNQLAAKALLATATQRPTKIVSTSIKVQFTCSFKEVMLSGRTDLKGVRTLLTHCSPQRVAVIRGSIAECEIVRSAAKSAGAKEQFVCRNFSTVTFAVKSERLRVLLPSSNMIEKLMFPVKHQQSSESSLSVGGKYSNPGRNQSRSQRDICSVGLLSGSLRDLITSNIDGCKEMRLITATSHATVEDSTVTVMEGQGGGEDAEEQQPYVEGDEKAEGEGGGDAYDKYKDDSRMEQQGEGEGEELGRTSQPAQIESSISGPILVPPLLVGAICFGEVLIKTIQREIEKTGTTVDYRLGDKGGMLVCGGQVIVRKDGDNNFVIEGPPCNAYFEARRVIYQQYAFV